MRSPIVQVSRIGARQANEDRVGHWTAPHAVLMAVADGLGGHLHGEMAAQIAIDVLAAAFSAEGRAIAQPEQFLARAMASAHAAIGREARRLELPDTPRTVIAACLVQDEQAFAAHVGDCRFYLVRGGRIVARSRDHTVVQRLVDQGQIDEDAAGTHPHRNRLLRCLGGLQAPQVEAAPGVALAPGDIVLLCSDGFWGPIAALELEAALGSRPLGQAIGELAAYAEARAGPQCDNISAVAMTWNPSA